MTSHKHANLFSQYALAANAKAFNGKVIAEYVWIDGSGLTLRSKCKTLEKKVTDIKDLPEWNFDGSSCYQATTENSEIILKPVAYFPDPFRGGDNVLVMCETY